MTIDFGARRRQLDQDGYSLLQNNIDDRMLEPAREVADDVLAWTDETHFEEKYRVDPRKGP